MKVDIPEHIVKEFKYLIELHKEHEPINQFDDVESLITYILHAVADGSRRPGAWERGLLEAMGINVNCEEHETYRKDYGKPN